MSVDRGRPEVAAQGQNDANDAVDGSSNRHASAMDLGAARAPTI
jgi:hypothetical protein